MSTAPLCSITSGTRNPPPISTASPRETITSLPSAKADNPRSNAEALLFTTKEASAPVISLSKDCRCDCLEPLLPLDRSNSRSEYPALAANAASIALSLRGDLPRLVWIITPVALITRLGDWTVSNATLSLIVEIISGSVGQACPLDIVSRA